jgi:hypothetical protein
MIIDGIDVYWVRIPLAFVWKTSYADQRVTDTVLVRMQSGGHHAWGESCPPYYPIRLPMPRSFARSIAIGWP